jgi:hypothetical protein
MESGLEMIVMLKEVERQMLEEQIARHQRWQAFHAMTEVGDTHPRSSGGNGALHRLAEIASTWTGRATNRRRPA